MRDLAFYVLEKDYDTPRGKQLYFYSAGQNLEEIPKKCPAISEASMAATLELGHNVYGG